MLESRRGEQRALRDTSTGTRTMCSRATQEVSRRLAERRAGRSPLTG